MKTKIIVFIINTFLFFAFTHSCVHAQTGNLPTVLSPEERIDQEVQKMINAGHLRPAYQVANEKYWKILGNDMNKTMDEYWSNPAETYYTLIRALPYVSTELQSPLRTYIKNEWSKYPANKYSHSGWSGNQREAYDIPQDAFSEFTDGKMSAGNYDNWTGYKFNPFNIYASYLYAKEFGNANSIFDQLRNKVYELPTASFTADKPHLLNMYIAGYYGYLNLQDLVGESRSSTVNNWLNTALQRRITIFNTAAKDLRGAEAGGFLYLVPELGDYLRQNALSKARTAIDVHNNFSAPYWFVSRADEVDRLHLLSAEIREEGSTSVYYDYVSLFNAKALILKEGGAELEKYLDVPAVARGDLYFILNLVHTIEAGGPVPTYPPTPTSGCQQGTVPGDANGDCSVDGFDYVVWWQNFDTVKTGYSFGDFNNSGFVDGFDYVIWWQNFGS